jgi:D-alanyl-lipoteichoic acid acyltransferase DltB (MBOAT superfamily)
MVEDALIRIAMGAFKKIVLADTLGALVDQVFAAPGSMPRWSILLATYGYAFQIYFDFSGYSDIAIGVAQLFGIRLPENFNRPYLATSPREFWHRWHITLSTWLRDYLYVPLGGNRHGRPRTLAAILVTMLLGGLWHGAAWTFVVWGAYHGVVLAGDRVLRWWITVPDSPAARWLGRILTFHLVCLGWVIFRSASLPQVGEALAALARPGFAVSAQALGAIVALGLAVVAHVLWSAPQVRRWYVDRAPWAQGVGYAVLIALVSLFSPGSQRFIYFQF